MEMTPDFGLGEETLRQLRETLARFPEIARAVIYGSRGRGDWKAASDIDLAIFAPAMPEARFAGLWNALDDLPVLYRMDVLHADRLENPSLLAKIMRDGKIFYHQGG